MAKQVQEYFPSVDDVKELQPEEIGMIIMSFFMDQEAERRPSGSLNQYNFMLSIHSTYLKDVENEIAEGLHWLYIEGMIADRPASTDNWIFVTRRGKALAASADLNSYLTTDLLPRESLDPVLIIDSRELFRKGRFDLAVLEAYRQVEIRVRKACGYGNDEYGTTLMGNAFHKENGPLTDKEQEGGERVAVRNIFTGAIGLFRNPISHRNVNINDPNEAAALILFADYLLKFVERRVQMVKEEG